jgi:hypothetical protein
VYDVGNKHIYFKTKSNPNIRFVNVSKFDFSCDTPVKILDITTGSEGNVTTLFSDYTYEANYDLISRSFSETEFLKNTPEPVLQTRAQYPETLPCEE